jgi:CRP-like cAMP-binding protein
MSFKLFVNHLQGKINLDQTAIEELRVRVKELSIIKGANLLFPGELCKYLYFVSEGFFRIYTSDGFEDKTVAFACPNHFLTALEGFFTQKILNEGIVCEENAVVLRISYHPTSISTR